MVQLVLRHSYVADRLPVVVQFPAGPRVRFKTVGQQQWIRSAATASCTLCSTHTSAVKAILGTIMSFPVFSKDMTLLEQIQVLERLGDEYHRTTGTNISEDILQTILARSLPKAVQQHIQLGMSNTTTYQEIRERVISYERVSIAWTKERILMECGAGSLGAVTSYASGDTGSGSMEVNLLQKGKGKKGKNAGKGKGQDSGKDKIQKEGRPTGPTRSSPCGW